jgi:stage V sporulation protein R
MVLAELRPLPKELSAIQDQMETLARQYGLDFFPTIFELVDADQLNAIAAYGGFPTRYPHWRFGMEFERLQKGYSYGLQKIYELVINNDPCFAYLLSSNALTDHMMVIAHVYGHCDFFKCNAWFQHTNRKMMDEMANHGNRIRRYMDRYGVEEVEEFIDSCLSVEDLIDIYSPFIRRTELVRRQGTSSSEEEAEPTQQSWGRLPAKDYMDSFINPPEALAKARKKAEEHHEAKEARYPAEPMRDIMGFLLDNAPLKPWQLDILSIVRDEAYYFAPQGQTKIMNEGWATYWHSTLMTRHGLIGGGDLVCYADHCSGTLASAPNRLNPYKMGVELFRDIEDRWNRGCHGKEYDACEDMRLKESWNTEDGKGREKIFEARRIHNDITFVDEFLTLEFCQRHKLFSFGYNGNSGNYEIESRKFEQVKQQLLFNLTNMGRPIIRIRDANHKNRGELYLEHQFNGPELQADYARDTLTHLYRLWTRPTHIETVLDNHVHVLSYDGTEHSTRKTNQKVES